MTVSPFPADRPDLGVPLHLIGPADALDLSSLVIGEPTFRRSIDGPSVITLTIADYYRGDRRTLLTSGQLNTRNFTGFDGVRFEQAAVSKSGDGITLTFEDAIVRALKRQKAPRVWNGGTITRSALARALAAEIGVPVETDPQQRAPISDAVVRNMTGKAADGATTYAADPTGTDTSWSLLGALASDIGWRACTDGERLLFGSDAWLMSRSPAITLRERTGPVQEINFELDDDQANATATVTVDVDRWAIPPGQPVTLEGMGPADGKWLVESFDRPYKRTRGTVTLIRARPSLVEPVNPPSGTDGDAGELDYLTDALGGYGSTAPSGSAAALERANSGPLGRFLSFAVSQSGKPYLLGASGPDRWDCSGLVQGAARAAGLNFPKPVTEQWARIGRGQGRKVSVAEGLATRGALLFRVKAGGSGGNGNHVAVSLAGDKTMEARGKATGCGIFDRASRREWTGAAILNWTQVNAVGTGQIGGPR